MTIVQQRILKAIVIGFVLILLMLFLKNIDWIDVKKSLRDIGWQYLLILGVSGLAYYSASLAWKVCMPKVTLSSWKLFQIRHVGEMLALINPTNVLAGDGLKYFLTKDHIKNTDRLSSSILISRVLLILSFVCLALITCTVFFVEHYIHRVEFWHFCLLFLVVLIGCLPFFLVAHPSLYLVKSYAFLKSTFLFREGILIKLKNINLQCYHLFTFHKKRLLVSFLLSIIHWVLGAVEYYVILKLLGVDIHLGHALLIEVGVLFIKTLGAFVPAQLGVEELANKMMLGIIAPMNPTVWVTVSILKRTRQLFWLIIALVMYLALNISKKQLNSTYKVQKVNQINLNIEI